MTTSRGMHLVRRPQGPPVEGDFEIVDLPVADPAQGQVLIQNLYLSLDPGFRSHLTAGQALNVPMLGMGMGRVVKSRHEGFVEGDLVSGLVGLQEYCLSEAVGFNKIAPDPTLPLSLYVGALGLPGLTAYVGMAEISKPRVGEQVFVSTAAGTVGSIAAQIAKIHGCRVIGSTGSETKARWLTEEVKLDAVINYKETPIGEALRAAAPDGLDLYFDNVGADHLDAALDRMKDRGRITVCGMIAAFNDDGSRGVAVRNMFKVATNRLTIQGFHPGRSLQDWSHLRPQFERTMTEWLKTGQLLYRETIGEGIDSAPGMFCSIMRGANIGKTLIRLSSD